MNMNSYSLVDVSLFFNETELLKIRLESLSSFVDLFIVVESSQTFSGNYKKLILPTLIDLKRQYGEKLVFISRKEFINSYEHLCDSLDDLFCDYNYPDEIKKLRHYLDCLPIEVKNNLPLLLDFYQRESLRFEIKRYTNNNDIIFFSDADEFADNIPYILDEVILHSKEIYSLTQHQFTYFPNLLERSNWLGTVCGRSDVLLSQSLNFWREKKAESRINTKGLDIVSGYHLTSMGGIDCVKEKIKSWAHQEYNNSYILNNLDKNIRAGADIFMRQSNTVAKIIDIQSFYSSHYSKALLKTQLPLIDKLIPHKSNMLLRYYRRLRLKLSNLFSHK